MAALADAPWRLPADHPAGASPKVVAIFRWLESNPIEIGGVQMHYEPLEVPPVQGCTQGRARIM